MNLLQMMPIPIFIPTDGEPLTDEGAKNFIGVFIFVNLLYVISWLITLGRYFLYLKRKKEKGYAFFESRFDRTTAMFDLLMVALWGLIVLVVIGKFIAQTFL